MCAIPFADDPCEDSSCLNGGTCMASQEEVSHFKCICKAGFSGARCEGTEISKTTPCQQFFPRPSTINCKRISVKVLPNVYESNAETVNFEL